MAGITRELVGSFTSDYRRDADAMRSISKRNFTTTRLLIGLILLLFALTFYYFSVLNVDYYRTGLLDLGWSDPSYYFAQAKPS